MLQSLGFWADRIIPFAVEVMADDVDGGEFVVGDFDRSGVRRRIEFATDLEACLRRGDVRSYSLARARRQVTHGDRNAEFVGEFL